MEFHALISGLVLILFGLSGCQSQERYVCIGCQYQTGVRSRECIDQAVNVTTSDKCEGKCATRSQYTKDTMETKFVWRGCATGGEGEDKCIETELDFQCSTTCAGHYCNDEPAVMSTASRVHHARHFIFCLLVGLVGGYYV